MSKGREMGRAVYKQTETKVDGSCHSSEGSKKVKAIKKGSKGSKGNEARGIKQGKCIVNIVICIRVYK